MLQPEIKVLPTPSDVAKEAADRILELSENAIEEKSRFSIALSGGSTPRALYQLLASPAYAPHIDWAAVDVFFGDERCVPPDHAESNYRMAREALLTRVPLPGDNVYRLRGEASDPNEAAKEYGEMLKEKFGDGGIDLVLLGMGDDGHTASLFPNSAALDERRHRCVANRVDKLKTTRLTMTAPFINRATNIIFMVCGKDKAVRLAEVLEGPRDPHRLPSQLIAPTSGKISWLIDIAAAEMDAS